MENFDDDRNFGTFETLMTPTMVTLARRSTRKRIEKRGRRRMAWCWGSERGGCMVKMIWLYYCHWRGVRKIKQIKWCQLFVEWGRWILRIGGGDRCQFWGGALQGEDSLNVISIGMIHTMIGNNHGRVGGWRRCCGCSEGIIINLNHLVQLWKNTEEGGRQMRRRHEEDPRKRRRKRIWTRK